MGDLHSRYIGGNLAFWDTHRKRIVDAIGPDVVKVILDYSEPTLITADAPSGWTTTLVGSSTVTLPDAVGGTLLLTTGATENDGPSLQKLGECFELTAASTPGQYAVYFGIKFQVSEATHSDFLAGLCITDTSLLAGMSDGVYFRKVDETTSMYGYTEKDSSETASASAATIAASTDYIAEWYYDGMLATPTVEFFVNGTSLGAVSLTMPVEFLTPSVELLTGSGNARTMTIDWLRAIMIGR